jgi:hypothetical protein
MIQMAGMIGVALFFLVGSVLILTNHIKAGLWVGGLALPFLVLALVDWVALAAWVRKKLTPAPKPAALPQPAPVKLKGEPAVPAAPPALPVPALLWPEPKTLSISVWWPLGLGVALFMGGALYSMALGHLLGGLGISVAGLLVVFISLKAGASLDIWLPQSTPKLAANLLGGCLGQVLGVWLDAHDHPYRGFSVTVLASVWMVYTLWKHLEEPLRERFGQKAEDLLEPMKNEADFSAQAWMLKGLLILIFFFGLFLWKHLSDFNLGLLCLVGGVLALVAALPLIPSSWHLSHGEPGPLRKGAALAAFALGLILAYRGQVQVQTGVLETGTWLFLVAGGLLLWAMPGEDPRPENPKGIQAKEFIPFLLVAAITFAIRFYRLDLYPYGVEGDEGGHALNCLATLRGQTANIFVNNGLQLFWYHSNTLAFNLFGINPGTIRFSVAFHGALSVLTLYFLLRLLFNWRVALATAFLMSVGIWNLHFSRFGHMNITQVFAQSVALYYMLRGLMTGRLLPFILAGFALSLAAQGHVSSRLLPVGVALFGVYLLITQPQVWKRNFPGILAFMICSWVMVSVVLVGYSRQPAQAFNRVKEVSIANTDNTSSPRDMGQGLLQNFKLNMYMFNHEGDARTRDNILAPAPLLDFWTGIFWALGFIFAVYYWRRPYYGMVLILFYTIALNSILSVEAPQSLRTSGNISIIFMMVAPVLARADLFLRKLLKGAGLVLATLGLIAIALLAGRANLKAYWQAVRHDVSFDVLPTTIGMEAGHLGPGYKVDFLSEGFSAGHDPCRLFSQPLRGAPTAIRSHAEVAECLPAREDLDHSIYYAFSDRYLQALEIPKAFYPGGRERDLLNKLEPTSLLFKAWDVPQAEVIASHQLKATYYPQARLQGSPMAVTMDAVVAGLGTTPTGAASGVWEGTLINYLFNRSTFTLPAGCQARLYLDGTLVSSTAGKKTVMLAAGLHGFRLEWFSGTAPWSVGWRRQEVFGVLPYFKTDGTVDTVVYPTDLGRWQEPMGLLAKVYAGQEWQGPPVEKVDPGIVGYWLDNPLKANSTVWSGWVRVRQAGEYSFRFATTGDNFALVEVDGKPVSIMGSSPLVKPPARMLGSIRLQPGLHPIRIRFSTPGRMQMAFEWRAQDLKGAELWGWELVPPQALKPEAALGL